VRDKSRTRCWPPATVVYVELTDKMPANTGCARCPKISGRDGRHGPWTGRVLADVGGFSFDQSQFRSATQALRQPGSSFKPSSMRQLSITAIARDRCEDAPIEIDTAQAAAVRGSRKNYSHKFYGPQTLRLASSFAQRDDGAARAGRRMAADRRIRQALGVYDDSDLISFALAPARRR